MTYIFTSYFVWVIWALIVIYNGEPLPVIGLFIVSILLTSKGLSRESIYGLSTDQKKTLTMWTWIALILDVLAFIYYIGNAENAILIGIASFCLFFPFLIMAITITKINKKTVNRKTISHDGYYGYRSNFSHSEREKNSDGIYIDLLDEYKMKYLQNHSTEEWNDHYQEIKKLWLEKKDEYYRNAQSTLSEWERANPTGNYFSSSSIVDGARCNQSIDVCKYCIYKNERGEHRCVWYNGRPWNSDY